MTIIHSSNFTSHCIAPPFQPTKFELLISCLKTSLHSFVYIVVYRPSSQPVTSKFIEEFSSLLETIAIYSSTIVITGDFNLHLDDSDAPHVTNFIQLLDAFNLRQHVREPTHVGGHTLDLVITAVDSAPSLVCVDPPVYSDHGLVTCVMPFTRRPANSYRTVLT